LKKLIYLIVLISFSSYSQSYDNNLEAIEICKAIQSNSFSSNRLADNALDKILSVIGASKNFVLQPCDNINNAVAISFDGTRYILYDKQFMISLDDNNNWGNLFILAHEVGHHINGHSLDVLLKSNNKRTLNQRRKQELEADEFAGFILAKLGGPIDYARKIITKISKNSDDTFSTHPNRKKRLEAVEKGYYSANNNSKTLSKFKLNYSLTVTKEDNVNEWSNFITKEKEIKLKNIKDPFKRMDIIEDSDIPDIKIRSWVYGDILDNEIDINFTPPKFVIVQEKYFDKSEFDYYNDMSLYLFDTYLTQKLLADSNKDEKDVLEKLINGRFKFEYIFDDGTKGRFKSLGIDNKPFTLRLDLNARGKKSMGNLFQFYRKEYFNFLQKLQNQSKIFIRLLKIDDGALYPNLIKTLEFNLKGSTKALSFE
jgi:hypothetical protein